MKNDQLTMATNRFAEWADLRVGKFYTTKRLSQIKPGEHFEIGNIDHVVLRSKRNGVLCMTSDSIPTYLPFDERSNNFATSTLGKFLNGIYCDWLSLQIGGANILEQTVNLFSSPFGIGYVKCRAEIALLSFRQYKKYQGIIPNADQVFWLVTPCRGSYTKVLVAGIMEQSDCANPYISVRPSCVLSPSLRVNCK